MGVRHFENHVGFAIKPAVGKLGSSGFFGFIAAWCTGLCPGIKGSDFFIAEVGVIFEFDVAWLGFPGRHDALGSRHCDHVAVSFCVCVAFETEGRILTIAVTLNAVVINDFSYIFGVGDFFETNGFGGGRSGLWN